MKRFTISQNAKNAIQIGTMCAISYLAVYVARNILGATTPMIVESGYGEEYVGAISSAFFIFYALGQLVNGLLGDKIKARYMISFGLMLAGVTLLLFPYILPYRFGVTLVYGLTGSFLSMIYGPMTKVVSENTLPIHASRCSLGYTFASLLGSPGAGMLAVYLTWQSVFSVSSAALIIMGVIAFASFLSMEKRGVVQYGKFKTAKKAETASNKPAASDQSKKQRILSVLRMLLRRRIVKFSLISIITGIVRTSVVFWLPTYISQHLSFTPQDAARIYTVATFVIATVPFISVFLYERMGRNMNRIVLIMFCVSALCFLLTYRVESSYWNIICLVLAIMSSNGATTILWSIYCPSLYDTGMVSSVTGFLDFLSYMAAATANELFSNAINSIGWKNLILVWFSLVAFGVIISLPYHRFLRKKQPQ